MHGGPTRRVELDMGKTRRQQLGVKQGGIRQGERRGRSRPVGARDGREGGGLGRHGRRWLVSEAKRSGNDESMPWRHAGGGDGARRVGDRGQGRGEAWLRGESRRRGRSRQGRGKGRRRAGRGGAGRQGPGDAQRRVCRKGDGSPAAGEKAGRGTIKLGGALAAGEPAARGAASGQTPPGRREEGEGRARWRLRRREWLAAGRPWRRWL
jgi:hypothetical protein